MVQEPMTTPNLTDLASLVGEQFAAKLNVLEKAIGDVHFPSLGNYKERLLADLLKTVVPKQFEVATGFVLFPSEEDHSSISQFRDRLNSSGFVPSKQCDVIIFDSFNYPVVFRDGGFVVVRPEAVRAVIEVKSTLSSKELDSCINSLIDFGRKWRKTQLYYRSRYTKNLETDAPGLFVLAWTQKMRNGSPEISFDGVRKKIAKRYADETDVGAMDAFPYLNSLAVYDEYEVSRLSSMLTKEQEGGPLGRIGFQVRSGRFLRLDHEGNGNWRGDRTIANLVAQIHICLDRVNFNRFFSYTEEVKAQNRFEEGFGGFSSVWELPPDGRAIQRALSPRLLPERAFEWSEDGPIAK